MSVSPMVSGIHLTSGFAESRRTGHISRPPIGFTPRFGSYCRSKRVPSLSGTRRDTHGCPNPQRVPVGGGLVIDPPTDGGQPVARRRCRDCRAALLPPCVWLCSDCVARRIDKIRKGQPK